MQIPLVYHSNYLWGIENCLHSFDTKKYGRIFNSLKNLYGINPSDIYTPNRLTEQDLLLVHTSDYISTLQQSSTIAAIAEVPFLSMFPAFILHSSILEPMKLATSGTILAGQLALQYGWAINLSGGYHHAKPDKGEGFCFFADIPLAIKKLPDTVNKVLIVDLDAHQGNGLPTIYARLGQDENGRSEVEYVRQPEIAILDFYNKNIYPNDSFARTFIKYNGALSSGTQDSQYLDQLRGVLPSAISDHRPDIIFYNAGTDIFEDDPLGGLGISREGIIERDEYVFKCARENGIPIAMVLSGGYTRASAEIITSSICNLHEKGLIQLR